jgi:6-phosphogluconolactonase (cycloisomerase 2 family)
MSAARYFAHLCLKFSVVAAVVLSLGACSRDGDSSPALAANSTPAATNTVGSASIGPAGGTVNGFYGAQIIVPPGALASTITIGLSRDSSNSPAFAVTGTDAVGATYELTPHGLNFAAPVTLRIPFDSAQVPNDVTPVLYKTEVGGAFAALTTTVIGSFLEATVTSFSWVIPAVAATKPRMVYAVSAGKLGSYMINRATGALKGPTSTAPVGEAPQSMLAHPSRRFLYATHRGSTTVNGIAPDTISMYPLSTINGQITGGPSGTTATGGVPGGNFEPALPVIHPNGRFLYVVNRGDISMLIINGTTGTLSGLTSIVNGFGAAPTGIGFNRLGTRAYVTYMYAPSVPVGDTTYVDKLKVYSVDPVTGLFTGPTGSAATGNNPWAVSVDVDDRFVFVASLSGHDIRVYGISGDAVNLQSSVPAQNQPASLAGDPLGRFLFAGKQTPFFSVNVLGFQVDQSSGSLSTANSILTLCQGGACGGPISVVADPQGQFVYALDANQGLSAFAINPTTGVLTDAGSLVDIYRPGLGGVGSPFKFAVTGTSPIWQNNCTHGCALSGPVFGSGGSGSGGSGSTSNPSPPLSYFLQVTQGAFFGTVTSSPGGIHYSPSSNDFSAEFPVNSSVELCTLPPAQPSRAYDITWMGSCSGTDICTTVNMTSDKQCHLQFSPVISR